MKLYLDLKKWVCGGGKTKFGNGSSQLLNNENYMCCLGQFSCQLEPKVELLDIGSPESVEFENKDNFLLTKDEEDDWVNYYDSVLSSDCIDINDDSQTSVTEKIKLLKKRLKKNNIELQIKNDKLFDSRGNFIGKHLLKNEWIYQHNYVVEYGEVNDLANFVNGKISAKELAKEKVAPFTQQLIKKVGTEKARKLIKKHLAELL